VARQSLIPETLKQEVSVIPERKTADESHRPDVTQFFRRHHVFIRTARDASHQCLFFLGLLYDTTTKQGKAAIAQYRGFAVEQVKSLIRGVHLPDEQPYPQWEEKIAQDVQDGNSTLTAQQRAAVRAAISRRRDWRAIFDRLNNLEALDVSDLRRALTQFLKDSRSEHRLDRLVIHWFPECLTYFRKNLALIWGIFLLAAVSFKVEAVNALLRNEGWGVLVPLALLLVPLVASRGWTLYRRVRTPEVVPFWDIAGSAFRSFRYQALEPGRLIERWPRRAPLRREIVKGQSVKLLAYAGWWLVAFMAVSLLHNFGVLGMGDSSLTVFLVFGLFYVVLILAHVVDFWEYLDPKPVRFLMLVAAFAGIVFLLLGYGREFFIVVFLLASAGYFYGYSRNRESSFRLAWAVIFLASAALNFVGRNTHARAVWKEAETPWTRLTAVDWPWPGKPDGSGPPVVVMAASGGGSRASVYTALALRRLNEEYPQIAAQLQAISSVSGGSLANAAYIARLLELGPQSADSQARRRALEDLDRDLSEDFLFPTLLGALTPGMTRGEAIERSWRDGNVRLGEHRLSVLAERWREARKQGSTTPPFPIPLFNTSTLDGHDVVISPLEKKLYAPDEMDLEALDPKTNPFRAKQDRDAYTWVYYRDGIYGLEDLLKNFDPLLSQSVRASANFPFGFPLVRVETERPLFFSPKGNHAGMKRVDLTDGGALSNSGMWSLFNLLLPEEEEKLNSLKERGVLLFVVEASKMPVYPRLEQSLNSLRSTIGDQGPVGQHLHRLMFERLEREYGDRLAIVQLDLVPLESFNVLTSWALDRRSIENLHGSFRQRWNEEKPALEASWRILHDRAQRGDHRLVAKRRPPLD
jgi:predicted acylesterase/phospholipase RssA